MKTLKINPITPFCIALCGWSLFVLLMLSLSACRAKKPLFNSGDTVVFKHALLRPSPVVVIDWVIINNGRVSYSGHSTTGRYYPSLMPRSIKKYQPNKN